MAAWVKARVELGTRVEGVERLGEGGLQVTARRDGKCFREDFDYVVAALPVTHLSVPAGLGPSAESDEPHIAEVMGGNVSVGYAAERTSDIGWANVVTPTLTYRFNQHFFVQAMVPWYLTTKNFATTTDPDAEDDEPLLEGKNLIGDTLLEGSVQAGHRGLFYELTGIVGLPTGKFRFALTAHKTTYNFTNHVELRIGAFTPSIELGEGNNSFLDDPGVRKGYVAVGPIANLRVGTLVQLPLDLELGVHLYEYLPLGKQKIYGTLRERDGSTRTVESVDGDGKAEDNGFTVEMSRSFGDHVAVTGCTSAA